MCTQKKVRCDHHATCWLLQRRKKGPRWAQVTSWQGRRAVRGRVMPPPSTSNMIRCWCVVLRLCLRFGRHSPALGSPMAEVTPPCLFVLHPPLPFTSPGACFVVLVAFRGRLFVQPVKRSCQLWNHFVRNPLTFQDPAAWRKRASGGTAGFPCADEARMDGYENDTLPVRLARIGACAPALKSYVSFTPFFVCLGRPVPGVTLRALRGCWNSYLFVAGCLLRFATQRVS